MQIAPANTNSDVITEFTDLANRERLLPIRVTPHYRCLVEEEIKTLGGTFGPLYKVAYPTRERIAVRAPGEVEDFVQDRRNMPPSLQDVIIHKYKNRLLFLITDKCAGHCMYCFRQDVLSDQHKRILPTYDDKVSSLIKYLQSHPEVQEVILSGGDPLNVPFKYLKTTLQRIKEEAIVPHIRMHTRNLVFAPQLFTKRVCHLFGEYDVRLVLHVVHPYEIDEKAIQAIQRVHSYGVRCYSQFPILRGINDHTLVLEQLLGKLDSFGIRPLSLFIADPINYSASFRVPLARLFSIIDELNWQTSAWINSVRLVLDAPVGKVRREDIIHWDKKRHLVVFSRDGKQVIYPDFPDELDTPSDITTLLWKS